MIEILAAIRNFRKTVKKVKAVSEWRAFVEADTLETISTQAAAYGFEIGRGKPLAFDVTTSPDNPFLNGGWREKLVSDAKS